MISTLAFVKMSENKISFTYVLVALFFIALAMKGLKKSQEYPPEVSECPDYWTINENGVCTPSLNKNTSGSCQSYETGDKVAFAQRCGIEWDGLTNV